MKTATILHITKLNYGVYSYQDNAVACCKSAKTKLEKLPLKEKIKLILRNHIENGILCSTSQKSIAISKFKECGKRKVAQLLNGQNGVCFFCDEPLFEENASIEHLVARSRSEHSGDSENIVACCITVNRMLGNMTVKNKINAVLGIQDSGSLVCPRKISQKQYKQHQDFQLMELYIKAVIGKLRKTRSRPRLVKSFCNLIVSMFPDQISMEEAYLITTKLVDRRNIYINTDGKIGYKNLRYHFLTQ